jgi:hypothetical protein
MYPRPFFGFFIVPFLAVGAPRRSSMELALLALVPGLEPGALPLLTLRPIGGAIPKPPPSREGAVAAPFALVSWVAPSEPEEVGVSRCEGGPPRRGEEVGPVGGPLTARGGPARGGGGVAVGPGGVSPPPFLLTQRLRSGS